MKFKIPEFLYHCLLQLYLPSIFHHKRDKFPQKYAWFLCVIIYSHFRNFTILEKTLMFVYLFDFYKLIFFTTDKQSQNISLKKKKKIV